MFLRRPRGIGHPAPNRRARLRAPHTIEPLEERRMMATLVDVGLPFSDDAVSSVIQAEVTTDQRTISTSAMSPVIAADAAGNYVAVWIENSAGTYGNLVLAQRYDAAGRPVGKTLVIADVDQDYRYGTVQVAMAANGRFAVSWSSSSMVAANGELLGHAEIQQFSADGTALGSRILAGGRKSGVSDLAIADDGSLVIATVESRHWSFIPAAEQDPADGPTVYIARYSATGQPLGSRTRVGLGLNARIAFASDGRYVLAWASGDIQGRQLYAQTFNADTSPASTATQVSHRPGQQIYHEVALNAQGDAVVTWLHEQGEQHFILAQRIRLAGGLWGGEVEISTDDVPALTGLSLAMGSDGRFFIGWAVVDNDSSPIRIQAFDPTATQSGPAFTIGSERAGAMATSLAVGKDGNLIAAWLEMGEGPRALTPASIAVVRHFDGLDWNVSVDLNGDPPGVNIKRNFVPGGSPALLADPSAVRIVTASQTITSAKITIEGYQSGDALLTYSTNPRILWSFNAGVLTLTGVDTVANYASLLNDIWFSTTANRAAGSKINIRVVVNDGERESAPAYSYVSIHVPGRSSIAGRHLFYNNSSFDGGNASANAADNGAIATDKTALLPGQIATEGNYTSYTRGINGIMVDLAGQHGEITVDDFIFRIGNSNDPSGWAYATTPSSIVVRPGAGVGGSDRVLITWADGAIQDTWLQVIVLDNGDTGLAAPDTFYFGNRVCDSGNEANRAQPQSNEALQLINRLRSAGANGVDAAISDPLDFDRNGRINTQDLLAVFNAIRAQKSALNMIHAPGGEAGLDGAIITGGVTVTIGHSHIYTASVVNVQTAIAATFANWSDDESEIALPLVSASPLMEEPD